MSLRRLFALCTLCLAAAACGPEDATGDLWQGDASELVGSWRDRDRREQGREYLVFDLSGVYRVVLDTPTEALETERGSYQVEDGVLIRRPTRHIDPSQVGRARENGIYAADESEIVLEPSDPGGAQTFLERVSAVPAFNELR